MEGHRRDELDAGVNPWDVVAGLFNDPEFKLAPHKIVVMHPDLRTATPGSVDGKDWSAGDLESRWTSFKGTLTIWKKNFEKSGQYTTDKAECTLVGTCM